MAEGTTAPGDGPRVRSSAVLEGIVGADAVAQLEPDGRLVVRMGDAGADVGLRDTPAAVRALLVRAVDVVDSTTGGR